METAFHFVMECETLSTLRAHLFARIRESLLCTSTTVRCSKPVPVLQQWIVRARNPTTELFLLLLGGDMMLFKPPEVGSDEVSDVAVPVFGPALPPPKRRSSPEWTLFRAMVRADVREVLDRHVRNFLLLAWRERERVMQGSFQLEYVSAVRESVLAEVGDAAPPSPPAVDGVEDARAELLPVSARAVRGVAARLGATLSVFHPLFAVRGSTMIVGDDDGARGGRARLVFIPHQCALGPAVGVGRAAELGRLRAGVRSV